MRLIDADALIDDIKSCLWDWESVDGITATTVLKQTIADIENQPTVSGWVSVKDRMPDELDCYLVSLINHGGIDIDVYHPDEKVFSHNRQYVECWMTIPPLPEPPEEDEKHGR